MRFLRSADRHGIDRGDAALVAGRAAVRLVLREEPRKELRIGFDSHARPLEVVVVAIRGEPFIVHAMRLRRRYHHLLEERR